jgi:addiction module RelE/StbE family toxin
LDRFARNWRTLVREGQVDFHDWETVLYLMQKDAPLPQGYHDHALTDDYQGYREFHLTGDIVVIYRPTPGRVAVVNVGTHAAMFGNRKYKRKGRSRLPQPFDEAMDRAMAEAARALKKLWRRRNSK